MTFSDFFRTNLEMFKVFVRSHLDFSYLLLFTIYCVILQHKLLANFYEDSYTDKFLLRFINNFFTEIPAHSFKNQKNG